MNRSWGLILVIILLVFQETRAENPDTFPVHPFDLGNREFIAGHFMEAIKLYTQAVEMDPGKQFADTAVFQIAKCYKALGDYRAAEPVFLKIPDSFPDSPWCDDALLEVARHHAKQATRDDYQEAAKLYLRILKTYAHSNSAPFASIELADCYLILGKLNDAEKLIYQVIDNPLMMSDKRTEKEIKPRAFFLLAQIYSNPNNANRNFAKAIEQLKKITDQYRNFQDIPSVYFTLGAIYQMMNQWDQAISHYQIVVDDYSGSVFAAIAQSNIADCFRDKNDDKRAAQALTKLVNQYPIRPASRNMDNGQQLIEQLKKGAETDKLRIEAASYENVTSNSKVIDYSGNVHIQKDDWELTADHARFDPDHYSIEAKGALHFDRAPDLVIKAATMSIDLKTSIIKGVGQVEMVNNRQGQVTETKGASITYDLKNNVFKVESLSPGN